MGKNDTYKLSEIPVPNYDAWEFRTRISAQSKDLLEMLLDNDPELTTGQNGKIWKAWKSRNDAAAELLVNVLDDDQLIHVRGLETEPAKMWERLKTVHEKTGVTGSATDLWTRFHTAAYTNSSIPLRNHISTIHSYAEALERLHSDKPSDTQIIAQIFTSLPPSYSTIIKILKNSEKADNLDYITEHILAEETTQKSADNFTIRPSTSALMATPKSNVICVNPVCKAANRVGHTIDNCFWPGGGKEGQWPEWWFKSRGIPADSSTSTTPSTANANIASTESHYVL